MNNNYIVSFVGSVLPILSISFILILLCYKFYIKLRSNFNTNVNCWFCNQNARVPYLQSNSWTCPKCEQYNGFTKDGDYNREIFQHRDCSNLSGTRTALAATSSTNISSCNGFCDSCNEAQRLKIEKLAQFEPRNESNFDKELKVFKAQLEEAHRLCSTCDRHLKKVLREKKKMVLGSKFLDFIIRGAENLKRPHFNQLRYIRQQQWKRRCSKSIIILAIFNIIFLYSALPDLNRDILMNTFGEMIGAQIFFIYSHVLALSRVLYSYVEGIASHPTAIKSKLFCRTLFMMMLYSMGLKWSHAISFHFSNLYILMCPFVLLSFAFAYNVVDGFKLTRYTFLMAIWSVFAGGLVDDKLFLSKDIVQLLASVITLVLSATCKNAIPSTKLTDESGNGSFHKIYSEDSFSDDDSSISIAGSINSTTYRSGRYCRRFSLSPKYKSSLTLDVATPMPNYRTISSPVSVPFYYPKTYSGMPCAPSENASYNRSYASRYNTNIGFPNSQTFVNSFTHHSPLLSNTAEINASCSDFESRSAYNSPVNVHATNLHKPTYLNSNGLVSPMLRSTINSLHNPPPVSPLLVAGSSVNHPNGNNVLTPSRFNNTCFRSNNTSTASSSWLSGGYFNHRNAVNINPISNQRNRCLAGHTQNLLNSGVEENFSRASSHSSGFESQTSRPTNASRDNSISPESNHDISEHSIAVADHVKGFQPIEKDVTNASYLPSTNSAFSVAAQCPTMHTGRNILFNGNHVDSFNLRKINEDLPAIKCTDLHLRSWKGQVLA